MFKPLTTQGWRPFSWDDHEVEDSGAFSGNMPSVLVSWLGSASRRESVLVQVPLFII